MQWLTQQPAMDAQFKHDLPQCSGERVENAPTPHILVKSHKTLRVTPAIAAGVTDRLWEIEDIIALSHGQTASVRWLIKVGWLVGCDAGEIASAVPPLSCACRVVSCRPIFRRRGGHS